MNVLVTGHTGMLGQSIVTMLQENTGVNIIGLSRSKVLNAPYQQIQCDLNDHEALSEILSKSDIDVIVHCAALVNLKHCEDNQALAQSLHVKVSDILSSYQPERTRFIYISTDSVFDGLDGNYREEDAVKPLNFYSKSKYMGEVEILKNNPYALILRTNIYGCKNPKGRSLVEWALNELQQGNQITGFTDVIFNPLHISQCAKVVVESINEKMNGVYHVGCKEVVSKYEFLYQLATQFKLNTNLIKKGVSTEYKLKPIRSLNTSLNPSKFNKDYKQQFSLAEGIKLINSPH